MSCRGISRPGVGIGVGVFFSRGVAVTSGSGYFISMGAGVGIWTGVGVGTGVLVISNGGKMPKIGVGAGVGVVLGRFSGVGFTKGIEAFSVPEVLLSPLEIFSSS